MLNKSTYRVVEDVDPYRSLRIKLTDKSKFEKTGNHTSGGFPVLSDAFPLLSPAFFFVAEGAKKKAWQKRTRRKEYFASPEATADRGGSDKPLKRLDRNFKTLRT